MLVAMGEIVPDFICVRNDSVYESTALGNHVQMHELNGAGF